MGLGWVFLGLLFVGGGRVDGVAVRGSDALLIPSIPAMPCVAKSKMKTRIAPSVRVVMSTTIQGTCKNGHRVR